MREREREKKATTETGIDRKIRTARERERHSDSKREAGRRREQD